MDMATHTSERRRPRAGGRVRGRVSSSSTFGVRSCVGCGTRVERPKGGFELVRFALLPVAEGPLRPIVDLGGGTFGRGAWVHPQVRCLTEAARRGFARAAKCEVLASTEDLLDQLARASTERAHRLVSIGVRSRKAVVGTTAVAGVTPELMLVAVDAAAQREVDVASALTSGRAVAFGTKRSLGDASGREVVGMVAITDAALATAVRDAVALSIAATTLRGL